MLILNHQLVHVFNEIFRLNGVEFHDTKRIVEEVKTPPCTIYSNKTLIKTSNMLDPLPNIPPSKPANATRSNADQPLIQNDKHLYSVEIMINKKGIVLFVDSIPRRMKMKDINS